MILSVSVAAIFFYFIAFVLKMNVSSIALFGGAVFVVHLLHKRRHFKTSQLSFFFLYAVVLLFWLKRYDTSSSSIFVYLLSSAALAFSLSDIFIGALKNTLKWCGWSLVGASISLMMNARFKNWTLSIFVGAIVLLIALRDKEHDGKNKDTP